MTRSWILVPLALLLAACSSSGATYVCGGCQGPHYSTTGFPAELRADAVTVCIAGIPCAVSRHPKEFASYSQPLPPLPATAGELDGRQLTVLVRSGQATWLGSAVIHDVPEQGPCDCGAGLQAEVALSRSR
jgi:hypothetical protein